MEKAGPGLGLLDILGLSNESKRFNDLLEEIGPEKISTFLDDAHKVVAFLEKADADDVLPKLIEAIRDSNLLLGNLLKKRVGYEDYKFLGEMAKKKPRK